MDSKGSKFDGSTTNKEFTSKVIKSCYADPRHKKLVPYNPDAPRSRPKEALVNVIGKRYGPHPVCSVESYKGQSQVQFASSPAPHSRGGPWKTTNQVFQETSKARSFGADTNPGIAADLARRMHKVQGINIRWK